MDFTEKQIAAMIRLAMSAVYCDGYADKSEFEVMKNYGFGLLIKAAKYNLNQAKDKIPKLMKESSKLSEKEAIEVLRPMSKKQKKFFYAFIVSIINADGIVTHEESDFFSYLNNELDLPVVDKKEAKEIFEEFLDINETKTSEGTGCLGWIIFIIIIGIIYVFGK
ncbi:MAG: hypothetical protein UHD07_00760 [Ruminobacter sp.]|nr:hypothetical protein [Ruminobacter sp.]